MINIRASSLPGLFDCPARWKAIHIENRRMPTNGKAALGQAVHASTAAFDQGLLDGSGLTIDDTAAAAVDVIYKPESEVVWDGDTTQSQAEDIALSLHEKYCKTIAPEQTYKAVEVECDSLEIEDLGISLTGTTDRVVETDEGLAIADIKTGKSVVGVDNNVKTVGYGYQIGVYEILAEHASGIKITAPAQIVGMNTAKTKQSQRMAIGEISDAKKTLLGDGNEPSVLEIASQIIHSGIFHGNPRSMLCHERYCPIFNQCRFRK